jgi:hypothetical protein
MKHLELSEHERRTLHKMGVFHPHPRTRMRAQGILRSSEGVTLQKTADEFGVHMNSVEQWRQRWGSLGWPDRTKGVIPAGRGSGRPSSNRLLASWHNPEAGPWSHCCVRLSKAETMHQSARTRPNVISRRCISRRSAIGTV